MKAKTTIVAALLALGLCGASQTAYAGDWGFGFGFGSHGGHFRVGYRDHGHRHHYRRSHRRYHRRHHHRRHHHHHVHSRYPVYHKVWVAPVYRTIVVGYDRCGAPIYDRVVTREGYYRRTISHYSCRSCGVRLH